MTPDIKHLIIIVVIMILSGSFGGYINYIHKFDIEKEDEINESRDEKEKRQLMRNYILLGVAAAILVPNFLQMISSDLYKKQGDIYSYLLFAGFCLIAAIFSRRFITTIGKKILDKVEKVEEVAKAAGRKSDEANLESSIAQERVEDLRSTINVGRIRQEDTVDMNSKYELMDIVNNYISETHIDSFKLRLRKKGELGRKMGQIIINNKLNVEELLGMSKEEGMILGIAYAIQFSPKEESFDTISDIWKFPSQLFTKYVIVVSIDALIDLKLIKKDNVDQIKEILADYSVRADNPLLEKIRETSQKLSSFGRLK